MDAFNSSGNAGPQTEAFSLVAALQTELLRQSQVVSASPLAILALQLASLIDQGIRVPECSREFRQCLIELKALSAGAWKDDTLNELQAKRERRRSG